MTQEQLAEVLGVTTFTATSVHLKILFNALLTLFGLCIL
jgi:hypothetical protein